jgi:hypothetical protein
VITAGVLRPDVCTREPCGGGWPAFSYRCFSSNTLLWKAVPGIWKATHGISIGKLHRSCFNHSATAYVVHSEYHEHTYTVSYGLKCTWPLAPKDLSGIVCTLQVSVAVSLCNINILWTEK